MSPRRRSFGVPEVLDEAADTVAAVAAPFLGLLWLTALPLRLAQCHFVARLIQLGPEASRHGAYLTELALPQALLLLPWAWGRAVFVRACRLGLRGQRPGRAALRVGAVPFAGYLYATALIATLSWATAWTLVTLPALVLMAALAAATHPMIERPGLLEPFHQRQGHGEGDRDAGGLDVVALGGVALDEAAVEVVGHQVRIRRILEEDEPELPNFDGEAVAAKRKYRALRYCATVIRRGGDPNIGPRLPALLKQSGFDDVYVGVVQPIGIHGEAKLINPLTMENIASAVLEDGLEPHNRKSTTW